MRPAVPCLLLMLATRAGAQGWQAGAQLELIQRAVAHRVARDADTLVSGWRADAHGIVRYASLLEHGDGPRERVVRADELEVEVYGEAPSRSKQIIRAWRDTSFLPNRIVYHRDHLGIVASDFGATIRLGQGDEVRDIPHPLSPAGLGAYQFAVGDTVVLRGPQGTVRVVAVEVRPVHPDSAGTVGTLYLDVDRAALVRFRFTFTPASYRDRTVEDITVTLENALQQNARWLPWRQSIVIRRALPWLDFPVKSVIRADWTIDDYQLGVHHPPDRFDGAYIDGPLAPMHGGNWSGPIALELGDLPATDADVADTRRQAEAAMHGRLLDGLPHLRILAAGVSDLIHVNRVQGVTLALGGRASLSPSLQVQGRLGAGLSDHRAVGSIVLAKQFGAVQVSLHADRQVVDLADAPIISGIANSLGTLVAGDDHGDYTLLERATVAAEFAIDGGRLRLSSGREWSQSVASTFHAIDGELRPNPSLGAGVATVVRASFARRGTPAGRWALELEAGDGATSWGRVYGRVERRIAVSSGELQAIVEAGLGTTALPPYRDFVLGGQGTLLGVPFRALGGRRMARAELWWAIPVGIPTPPVPYSRYAHLVSSVGPLLAAGSAGGEANGVPWLASGRIEVVAGLRADLWGRLLRVEAAVSLRTGRVGFSLDVHPDWWGMM